jgi:predicted nuclease of predicted toxin-antitoxin system
MRPAIAEQLRVRGIDALTTAEAGRAHQGLSDEDQLTFATADQRMLVTEDSDFVRLVATLISFFIAPPCDLWHYQDGSNASVAGSSPVLA